MFDSGLMGVDWEQRIDFARMRRERLEKAKAAVDVSGLDAMITLRLEDVRYLTGFRSHLGPTTIFSIASVFLPKGGDPILFTQDLDHARARMPWLRPDQLQPRSNFREAPGIRKYADRIKGLIGRELTGIIGIDMWTPNLERAFKEALPNCTFVDGNEVLTRAKIIKTADELACLQAATVITEAAMDEALRFLRPGVKECEVLAVAWQAMTRLGSEWTQCANIVTSGPGTAPYRRYTTDRIIRLGDPVVIDIGGCCNGYWGDFTRTWICGGISPTQEQIALHQQTYDDLFNACAQARPGNTNADVFRAAEPVILESLGHGAGVNPWEPPYLSPESKDAPMELKPGMVLNIEPWHGRPGVGGFRLENNLVVTESDPEIFTPYPFDERLVTDLHPLDVSTGRTRPRSAAR